MRPYYTIKTRFALSEMKLKEYFLKDCQSFLTVVKENLKRIDPVCASFPGGCPLDCGHKEELPSFCCFTFFVGPNNNSPQEKPGLPYFIHAFPMAFPYFPHTLLILSSYFFHTLFIQNSYTPHT